ncbi:Hypothetical predicted protein [Olea europaea subsp. europaea]|uniref:Uncharacterized protein n=1 Tax=Olea europaea subsp. europaea TaxID=158383 RepID=A0A8S0QE69_OLEEU|nr:Hypothetical predicted protein [Olea europaea subsp. europaea]
MIGRWNMMIKKQPEKIGGGGDAYWKPKFGGSTKSGKGGGDDCTGGKSLGAGGWGELTVGGGAYNRGGGGQSLGVGGRGESLGDGGGTSLEMEKATRGGVDFRGTGIRDGLEGFGVGAGVGIRAGFGAGVGWLETTGGTVPLGGWTVVGGTEAFGCLDLDLVEAVKEKPLVVRVWALVLVVVPSEWGFGVGGGDIFGVVDFGIGGGDIFGVVGFGVGGGGSLDVGIDEGGFGLGHGG